MSSSPSRLVERWSDHLSALIAVDIGSAALSAAFVAPVVTVIDRAVVEKSSTNTSLLRVFSTHSLSVFRQPRRFFLGKPFFIVWILYAATYATANVTETLAKNFFGVADKATVGSATFISTFLVNVPLGLWKDVRFAQFYSVTSRHSIPPPAKEVSRSLTIPRLTRGLPVPMGVCAAFLLRDGLTIFGSFPLAKALSATIPNSSTFHPHAKVAIIQLVVPAMTQLVATPIHLFGLDIYNRPHAVTLSDRLTRIRRDLRSTTVARCLRIIPPFGFGCIMNTELRSFYYKRFQEEPSTMAN